MVLVHILEIDHILVGEVVVHIQVVEVVVHIQVVDHSLVVEVVHILVAGRNLVAVLWGGSRY